MQDTTDTANGTQRRKLANAMAHLLEIVDEGLSLDEVSLPERPFRATTELLRHGLVEVKAGEAIDAHRIWNYLAEPWFRALFTGVEEWYRDQYRAEALAPKGNPPLIGVVLVRGSPFAVHVPMHRGEIEVEGKTAWMFFEAGLGNGEEPRNWLIHGPNFDRLNDDQTRAADAELHAVATALRAIQFYLNGAGQDQVQRGLRGSIRSYLENAARRIHAQTAEEFALAWMDLQMAAESALKLVIFRTTGAHPHKHGLHSDLLSHEGAAAVVFDPRRLASWPSFKTISHRRYGQDYMAGLSALYAAYKLILDLVVACVGTVDPPLPSGAGFLVHVAPYLVDDPILPRRDAR